MLIFDSFSKELKTKFPQDCDCKTVERQAEQLRSNLFASNSATPENKACADAVARRRAMPDVTFAAHRETGELRQFNLSDSKSEKITGRRRSPSAESLSEHLLGSAWRVATLEEEQEELERRAAQNKKLVFASEHELRAKELQLASRALEFVQPSAPAAPKKDTK